MMLRRCVVLLSLGLLLVTAPAFAQPLSTRVIPPQTARQNVSPLDAISLVLGSQNYYIAPLLQHEISSADIQAATDAANSKFRVQIVLLDKLPTGFSATSIAQKFEGDAARILGNNSLNPFASKTPLVIVIAGNQIAARGADLPPEELDAITERAARTIDGGTYRMGLMQIISTAAYLQTQRQMRLWQMGGAATIILLFAVFMWRSRNRNRRKRPRFVEEDVVLSS